MLTIYARNLYRLGCEFCELFKDTYFVEDLRTTGSETPVPEVSL